MWKCGNAILTTSHTQFLNYRDTKGTGKNIVTAVYRTRKLYRVEKRQRFIHTLRRKVRLLSSDRRRALVRRVANVESGAN